MKNFLLLSFISGFLFVQAVSAQTVRGIVFEDINQNSKKDRKEKVLPNVAVSNGIDVVLTNNKGEYTLPVSDDNIIFVIKPSGYNVPVDQDNLPRYYYIHKPNGSPELKFKGVEATGPLPKSVDFGLTPTVEKDEFQILVFGDPQVYNEKEVEYFEKGIITPLKNSTQYAFGISLGDLVGNKPTLFNPYIQAVKQIGIPWYQVMGNHDMNFDVTSDTLSDESFEAHFGPNNYAFNYGKVHFIVLDDIIYQGPHAKRPYIGGLR
ncbi:MAG TPA: metallophosphoesterase N-terminal domain-containing protein, partial [Sphingobacterium sp.]|nr:metallophosphoesterase N-terminal domain-containing protein [Sphingobacterium sp.]